jgi:hypothetical protein
LIRVDFGHQLNEFFHLHHVVIPLPRFFFGLSSLREGLDPLLDYLDNAFLLFRFYGANVFLEVKERRKVDEQHGTLFVLITENIVIFEAAFACDFAVNLQFGVLIVFLALTNILKAHVFIDVLFDFFD